MGDLEVLLIKWSCRANSSPNIPNIFWVLLLNHNNSYYSYLILNRPEQAVSQIWPGKTWETPISFFVSLCKQPQGRTIQTLVTLPHFSPLSIRTSRSCWVSLANYKNGLIDKVLLQYVLPTPSWLLGFSQYAEHFNSLKNPLWYPFMAIHTSFLPHLPLKHWQVSECSLYLCVPF